MYKRSKTPTLMLNNRFESFEPNNLRHLKFELSTILKRLVHHLCDLKKIKYLSSFEILLYYH